uniref:Uncharacterized protein n=1 Tax=Cacopsylla melanoneura TaxID=428564 RepID=A0A8D8M2B3_9HEMI
MEMSGKVMEHGNRSPNFCGHPVSQTLRLCVYHYLLCIIYLHLCRFVVYYVVYIDIVYVYQNGFFFFPIFCSFVLSFTQYSFPGDPYLPFYLIRVTYGVLPF